MQVPASEDLKWPHPYHGSAAKRRAKWLLFSDGLDLLCGLSAAGLGRLAARSGRLQPPSAGCGAQPEGGEAGQVDRSSQQLEVLAHADQPAHASAAAAVAAAQQVGELALDLGAGCSVVGPPGGIAL